MKKLEDWSFDDLCVNMGWEVIQGITRGDKLNTIMWRVCSVSVQWREEQLKKEKHEKK